MNYPEFNRLIRSMARQKGISLRGTKDDIVQWNGYSFDPYRFIAIKVTYAITGRVDDIWDIWEGQETGNFLPVGCSFAVIEKNQSATETVNRLWSDCHK